MKPRENLWKPRENYLYESYIFGYGTSDYRYISRLWEFKDGCFTSIAAISRFTASDNFGLEQRTTWNVNFRKKHIPSTYVILYSYFTYKSKRFFEILG
jgi:hypothetical protein